MRVRNMFLWGAVSTLLLSVSCLCAAQSAQPDRKVNDAKGRLNFKKDIQPIFDANCVVCHQTGGGQGGLTLESGKSYESTVMRPSMESKLFRIVPGAPEKSYLMHKLEGTHIQVGGGGDQMPTTGPLDPDLVKVIRRWILEGAKK